MVLGRDVAMAWITSWLPGATVIAVDADPLLLALGRAAWGDRPGLVARRDERGIEAGHHGSPVLCGVLGAAGGPAG